MEFGFMVVKEIDATITPQTSWLKIPAESINHIQLSL